ncbi:MAG: hypothetical protein KC996_04800 [Phycisphaerales bacterium]|nr:hypothetical protein [Phycisphaerales bacterium]
MRILPVTPEAAVEDEPQKRDQVSEALWFLVEFFIENLLNRSGDHARGVRQDLLVHFVRRSSTASLCDCQSSGSGRLLSHRCFVIVSMYHSENG